jgi:hypothetical protein
LLGLEFDRSEIANGDARGRSFLDDVLNLWGHFAAGPVFELSWHPDWHLGVQIYDAAVAAQALRTPRQVWFRYQSASHQMVHLPFREPSSIRMWVGCMGPVFYQRKYHDI